MDASTLRLEFMYFHLICPWRPAWGSEGLTEDQVQMYTSQVSLLALPLRLASD